MKCRVEYCGIPPIAKYAMDGAHSGRALGDAYPGFTLGYSRVLPTGRDFEVCGGRRGVRDEMQPQVPATAGKLSASLGMTT